jgi:acetyl esterase/lipase
MPSGRSVSTVGLPERVIVGGASAGGNLAAAMLLRARDEGLPLPAAAVLMTPAADLTESGDSHQVNLGLDPHPGPGAWVVRALRRWPGPPPPVPAANVSVTRAGGPVTDGLLGAGREPD